MAVGRILFIAILSLAGGCHSLHHKVHRLPTSTFPQSSPRELCKATLPEYRVEPPDILEIEVVRLVPNAGYRLSPGDAISITVSRRDLTTIAVNDVLAIQAEGAPAIAPLDGSFVVQPNGAISLGSPYGLVQVAGLSIEEAQQVLETKLDELLVVPDVRLALVEAGNPVSGEFVIGLDGIVDLGANYGKIELQGLTLEEARSTLEAKFSEYFKQPYASLTVTQLSAQQQIAGEHLVGPDGNITLGVFGTLPVVAMTIDEVRQVIEARLQVEFDQPRVSVNVFSYNSKVYYVVTEGAGLGDGVFKFPFTGNDTILDAVALLNGLPSVSSTQMWIARPSHKPDEFQILPVDWQAVTSVADTRTNYQLLPGDRLFIAEDSLVGFDNRLAKVFNPLERIMGFSILSASAATRFSGRVLRGGGNPIGRF